MQLHYRALAHAVAAIIIIIIIIMKSFLCFQNFITLCKKVHITEDHILFFRMKKY